MWRDLKRAVVAIVKEAADDGITGEAAKVAYYKTGNERPQQFQQTADARRARFVRPVRPRSGPSLGWLDVVARRPRRRGSRAGAQCLSCWAGG